MNALREWLDIFRPKSGRAAFQLVVAALGGAGIVVGIGWILLVVVAFPRTESGFTGGLALLVGGVHLFAGFAVLSAGLSIPQRTGEGVQFSRRQRLALVYGAVAPVGAILAIPIGSSVLPPVSGATQTALVGLLAIVLLSGPVVTLTVIGHRVHIAVSGDRTESAAGSGR